MCSLKACLHMPARRRVTLSLRIAAIFASAYALLRLAQAPIVEVPQPLSRNGFNVAHSFFRESG
jgi:hypothetical protein